MTKTDVDDQGYSGLRKALLVGGGGLTLLFLAGVFAGFTAATLEHGTPTPKDAAIMLVIAALITAVMLALWKLWPRVDEGPIAQSTRKSRNWMYAILGFSFVAGLGFALAEGPEDNPLFSNAPIDPMIAALALVAWLIVSPALAWAWWRSIDEHEASTYRESSFWTLHIYFLLVPAWWFGSRAGWVPEQDPMIVFIIVTFVWSIIWLYRKYA